MQGGYGGGKPAPAPIFNHRKRPRQAMFADPTSQSETLPTNRGPDLMPVGGFPGNQNKRPGQYRPQHGQKTAYNAQQTYLNQGMNEQSQQNRPGNVKTGGNQRNWGQQNQMRINPSTDYKNRNTNQQISSYTNSNTNLSKTRRYQQSSMSSNRGQQYNQTGYPSHTNTPVNYQQQNNGVQQGVGYRNMAGGNNHTVGYNNTQIQPHHHGNRPQPSSTQGNRNNRPASSAQHNYAGSGFGSKFQYSGACGPPSMGDQLPAGSLFNQAVYGGNGRSLQSFDQTSGRDIAARNNKPQPKKTADKNSEKPSLRVLTANLDTVLKSAALSDQIGPHLFEVFGVLDTAVVSDKSRTGREFVLRDETASINCVFYEIDRNLPRLIRGQWQRCVGSLDGRSGRLKCVSVRAVQGEEKQLARLGQRHTEQVLAGLGRMAHEQ